MVEWRDAGFQVRTCFWIIVATLVAGATSLHAWPVPEHSWDLSITSDVLFSTLDGGVQDKDGMADGNLTVRKLYVANAQLIIDVPIARIRAERYVALQGAVVGPASMPQIGPRITIESGEYILVGKGSAVVADGNLAGGDIRLCSGQYIQVLKDSRVSADGIGPVSSGGTIHLQAEGSITVHRVQRHIRTNGGSGGRIRMVSCAAGSDDPSGGGVPSILIQGGAIQANGVANVGGIVELVATIGDIEIGPLPSMEATGVTGPGSINFTAAQTIQWDPAQTDPAAIVHPDTPSAILCHICPDDGPQPECVADAECDDGNVCTDDACISQACQHTNNASGCDDGLFCTFNDVCAAGLCTGSGDSCPGQQCDELTNACVQCLFDGHCDDANLCTDDLCVGGLCQTNNNTVACDDQLYCTATDTCIGGVCVGSGDTCSGQMCDETLDACVNCLNDANCEDGNGCTNDSCVSGACQYTHNSGPCDDQLFCTAVDVCSGGVCVGSGNPCGNEPCNEDSDFCGDLPPPPPILDAHPAITMSSTVTIMGTALQAVEVRVDGHMGVQTVPVADNRFTVDFPLRENSVNTLYFTSIGSTGLTSAPATTFVTHDAQPPFLFIDVPADGEEFSTATTDVAGRVGDLLSGFMGLSVTVNGIAAMVDVGIGNNGTYLAQGVPLLDGQPTPIIVVATDALGNSAQEQITVTRVGIGAGVPYIEIVSGNGQSAPMGSVLSAPIVVRVHRGNGQPFSNKVVTFHVTRSNGRLTPDGGPEGEMKLQVHTNANGLAQAHWRLGSDAGCGNNRVKVSSKDVMGTVVFCATATSGPPKQINIGGGNNQRCETGAPATEPLKIWVNDGCNGVSNVPVTFTVVRGNGKVNGETNAVVLTSITGHAQVNFTTSLDLGNNIVQATFPGNSGRPAEFNLWGSPRSPLTAPGFYGTVFNNSGVPIGGATCTLVVGDQLARVTTTGVDGNFVFDNLSAAGPADLIVNGLTANTLGGNPIPQGTFPSLHFLPVLVPNVANCLPAAILLPELNPNNRVPFDNSCDVELTVQGVEGLRMIVKRGSMKRSDGSAPSPADPAILSLNQVHFEDVPMPMPNGASPPFAWTLQPSGATFDPPVQIIYPNMSGLPAGAISYFLSFNHDTNRFEIVATGRVNDEGSFIESDPGTGIPTAGWGGNCPPYTVTGSVENECPDVQINSLSPSGTMFLGADLAIQYTITGENLDQASLSIYNSGDQLVYHDAGIPTAAGTHMVTWPETRWNQGSTAYANPLNGPYTVAVSGARGLCFPNAVASIGTSLVFSADVADAPSSGATASAGLCDMFDALKVVLRQGMNEFEFFGSQIVTSDITNGLHITVVDPILDTLFNGTYEVIFRDLRDEIGNFADNDADLTNGAEIVVGTLELQ